MKEKEVVIKLSDHYGGGIGISPRGIESNFEEIEVDEVTWIGDQCEIKTIATITGYLNAKIEIVVKWDDDKIEKYKDNKLVFALIEQGKELILGNLKSMAAHDGMYLDDEDDDFYEVESNEDGYSKFELSAQDRIGNDILISVNGVDDNELAHFGGLDLHIKSVKTLISNTHGIDFARDNGDFAIEGKVFALYLNEIGELMRNLSPERNLLKDVSNMDLVKHFINHWSEDKELVAIIDKDNKEIRKETEAIRKEEDEIWNNMQKQINNKLN
ncbi:hypothetical protein [Bacillus sp. OK048]|uniref:hypothetical protein n=1 Tax=Bacillus sp. OK048 TaxID=1882761 RepID=UPI0008827DD3|nr:hypothetical protein [Bacillus sp. OK048]SDN62438.1 hypothetical protein SAMN05443253_11530 [Bacillus sp. OK048]